MGGRKGSRDWRDDLDSDSIIIGTLANKVSPGLRVTVEALYRADGTGYLVVVVPESPAAPHMVDDRYDGRSATAAQPLSDTEVRRLWSRHVQRRAGRSDLLAVEVEREPVPTDLRRGARLFALAQPVSADPRLLLSACDGKDLRSWVGAAGGLPVFAHPRQYNPHLGAVGNLQRRARGVARSSHHLDSDRTVVESLSSPGHVVDLEIWEDGGIRLYYDRASDSLRNVEYLMLSAIAGEVSGVIELAREVSAKASFRGSWSFGVALRGMKSLPAYGHGVSGEAHWRYSEDDYDETIEVDNATLMDAGSPALEELVGRLLRSTFSQTDVTLCRPSRKASQNNCSLATSTSPNESVLSGSPSSAPPQPRFTQRRRERSQRTACDG